MAARVGRLSHRVAPPPESLFVWYAAVFTLLYRVLVAPDCTCRMIEPGCEIVPRRDYRITRS